MHNDHVFIGISLFKSYQNRHAIHSQNATHRCQPLPLQVEKPHKTKRAKTWPDVRGKLTLKKKKSPLAIPV